MRYTPWTAYTRDERRALLHLFDIAAESVRDSYPDIAFGGCAVFARVIHERTGYPFVLIFDDGDAEDTPPWHVMVQLPNGELYDSYGRRSRAEVRRTFNSADVLYPLRGKALLVDDPTGLILAAHEHELGIEGGLCSDFRSAASGIRYLLSQYIPAWVK